MAPNGGTELAEAPGSGLLHGAAAVSGTSSTSPASPARLPARTGCLASLAALALVLLLTGGFGGMAAAIITLARRVSELSSRAHVAAGIAGLGASRLETLPLPLPSNATELTFLAHGSCSNQQLDLGFWRTIVPLAPQLFYFNGDIVYGNCAGDLSAGRQTCPQLEAAWAALFNSPAFAAAARAVPMAGMLDDHDYGANDAGRSNPYKYYAKALFLRRFGVPAGDPRWHRPGLYTASTHGPAGRRVQLVQLDTRYSRSALRFSGCRRAAGEDCHGRERYVPYSAAESGAHSMLGEGQVGTPFP